jgi:S-adenosylmethionine:tRNA ribosyltransferase-isomerase
MRRQDFSYQLPAELIAQQPRPRGTSRMMVVEPRQGPPEIRHEEFQTFPDLVGSEDLIVINDTRVIPARLFALPRGQMKRPIEFLLTRRVEELLWETWCKPARRVRPADHVEFSERLSARVEQKRDDGTVVLRFEASSEAEFWVEIRRIGVMPLPPYIARSEPREGDRESYQTVYAAREGAIAAPTAGLHFTPEILRRVEDRLVRITLHVGIGTFQPVKADRLEDHRMQEEWYEISAEAAARLNAAMAARRPIVAVGTTSVRALESAFRGSFVAGSESTSLFITPGYQFQVVDRLLTNFHLPESTLLMLVSAFAGIRTIREGYRVAIEQGYRFYSYGDCMLIRRRGDW